MQKRIYIYIHAFLHVGVSIRGTYTRRSRLFPECPALTSSNNNNNKKGWRPRFNQRVCLPDVINSKSPGKTSEKRERESEWKGKEDGRRGGKDAGWMLSFSVFIISPSR